MLIYIIFIGGIVLKMKKIFIFLTFIFLFIVGCDKNNKEKDIKKDELVIAVGNLFDNGNFDPKQKYGSHHQHRLTHHSLLKYDNDLNLIGDFAKDYKISEDGMKWIFNLKDNIKLSNGENLTAEDVIFTYEMLKNDGIAFNLSFVQEIKMEEGQLVITLDKPNITFVSQLTEIPIVPKKYYDENYSRNPIGSGPYVVKEHKKGEQVIMEANPYYEAPLEFKKLTFLLLKEDGILAAAKAGKLDVAFVPPTFSDQKIKNMTLHAYETIDSRGITLPTLPSGNKGKINGLDVEVGNDITSDVAIRRALTVGLNREELIKLALEGYGKPAYSLCDYLPWFNEETVVKDGDIEKAREILITAGWQDVDNDGIFEKNGKKAEFKLYYNAKDQLRSDLAIAVADQVKRFGIKIEAVGSNWDEIFVVGKANAILWGGGRHHPYQLYTMNSSKVIDTGYNNMSQYKNEKVDENLEKAMTSINLEESYKYWKKAQWDEESQTGFSYPGDVPIVWLTRIDHLYFISDSLDVGKQQIHSHGHEWGLFSDISQWKNK